MTKPPSKRDITTPNLFGDTTTTHDETYGNTRNESKDVVQGWGSKTGDSSARRLNREEFVDHKFVHHKEHDRRQSTRG